MIVVSGGILFCRTLTQVSFEGPEALVVPWFLAERHYKTVSFSRSVSAA
jgi:hypothetical protein